MNTDPSQNPAIPETVQRLREAGDIGFAAVMGATSTLDIVDGARLMHQALGAAINVIDEGQAIADRERAARLAAEREVDFLMFDPILTSAIPARGLELLLREETTDPRGEKIQEAMKTGTLAAAFIDLRNLGGINELHGHEVGNIYLSNSGNALRSELNHLGRFGVLPDSGQHRRTSEAHETDFMVRYGGDEVVVLFTGIERGKMEEATAAITRHLRGFLSVEAGFSRDAEGKPPLMASVGVAHLGEPELAETIQALWSSDLSQEEQFKATYSAVVDLADARQIKAREEQYTAFRTLLAPHIRSWRLRKLEGKQLAMEVFSHLFPHFRDNIDAIATQRQEEFGITD